MLIGTLTFGFMSGVEHKALAQFFVSAVYLLIIPAGIWTMYTFKILNFNRQQMFRDENHIIFNVAFVAFSIRTFCISIFVFLQLLPVVLYGAFLVMTAWSMSLHGNALMIAMLIFLLWLLATIFMMAQLRNPYREKRTYFLKRWIDRRYSKSIFQFYTGWLLRRDPVMIAGTKIFACALIFGVCRLYSGETYDWRLIAMGLTAAGVANLFILFQIQEFERTHISWIRNMPLRMSKRFLLFCVVLTILILPEVVVLIKYFPVVLPLFWLIISVIYFLSLGAFFYGLLHWQAAAPGSFTKKSFGIFIVFILLILFKVPLAVIALINLTAGFGLYRKYYYSFQPESQGIT